MLTGPDFYDDDAIFSTYSHRRSQADSPNDTLEKPVLLELIGEPAGKRFLDLGCGAAAIGRELLAQGASVYVGIDGSHKMATLAAQTLAGTRGKVITERIEAWSPKPAAFDLVVSRLALHYVADLASVFRNVYHTLAQGGIFIFSVEHPIITSNDSPRDKDGLRHAWTVDNYFLTGERTTQWMGGTVLKYHRTIEDYFRLLQAAGLQISDLREARPQPEIFVAPPDLARRMRIPLFLILAAHKAA